MASTGRTRDVPAVTVVLGAPERFADGSDGSPSSDGSGDARGNSDDSGTRMFYRRYTHPTLRFAGLRPSLAPSAATPALVQRAVASLAHTWQQFDEAESVTATAPSTTATTGGKLRVARLHLGTALRNESSDGFAWVPTVGGPRLDALQANALGAYPSRRFSVLEVRCLDNRTRSVVFDASAGGGPDVGASPDATAAAAEGGVDLFGTGVQVPRFGCDDGVFGALRSPVDGIVAQARKRFLHYRVRVVRPFGCEDVEVDLLTLGRPDSVDHDDAVALARFARAAAATPNADARFPTRLPAVLQFSHCRLMRVTAFELPFGYDGDTARWFVARDVRRVRFDDASITFAAVSPVDSSEERGGGGHTWLEVAAPLVATATNKAHVLGFVLSVLDRLPTPTATMALPDAATRTERLAQSQGYDTATPSALQSTPLPFVASLAPPFRHAELHRVRVVSVLAAEPFPARPGDEDTPDRAAAAAPSLRRVRTSPAVRETHRLSSRALSLAYETPPERAPRLRGLAGIDERRWTNAAEAPLAELRAACGPLGTTGVGVAALEVQCGCSFLKRVSSGGGDRDWRRDTATTTAKDGTPLAPGESVHFLAQFPDVTPLLPASRLVLPIATRSGFRFYVRSIGWVVAMDDDVTVRAEAGGGVAPNAGAVDSGGSGGGGGAGSLLAQFLVLRPNTGLDVRVRLHRGGGSTGGVLPREMAAALRAGVAAFAAAKASESAPRAAPMNNGDSNSATMDVAVPIVGDDGMGVTAHSRHLAGYSIETLQRLTQRDYALGDAGAVYCVRRLDDIPVDAPRWSPPRPVSPFGGDFAPQRRPGGGLTGPATAQATFFAAHIEIADADRIAARVAADGRLAPVVAMLNAAVLPGLSLRIAPPKPHVADGGYVLPVVATTDGQTSPNSEPTAAASEQRARRFDGGIGGDGTAPPLLPLANKETLTRDSSRRIGATVSAASSATTIEIRDVLGDAIAVATSAEQQADKRLSVPAWRQLFADAAARAAASPHDAAATKDAPVATGVKAALAAATAETTAMVARRDPSERAAVQRWANAVRAAAFLPCRCGVHKQGDSKGQRDGSLCAGCAAGDNALAFASRRVLDLPFGHTVVPPSQPGGASRQDAVRRVGVWVRLSGSMWDEWAPDIPEAAARTRAGWDGSSENDDPLDELGAPSDNNNNRSGGGVVVVFPFRVEASLRAAVEAFRCADARKRSGTGEPLPPLPVWVSPAHGVAVTSPRRAPHRLGCRLSAGPSPDAGVPQAVFDDAGRAVRIDPATLSVVPGAFCPSSAASPPGSPLFLRGELLTFAPRQPRRLVPVAWLLARSFFRKL